MLSVLTVSTLDGWVGVFYDAANAYAVDYQPSENNNVRENLDQKHAVYCNITRRHALKRSAQHRENSERIP